MDPMTMQPVETVKKLRDREVQRALMQYFKPENWFVVHRALLAAGRKDLVGDGPLCLIPAEPPRAAIAARRREALGRGRRGSGFVHARDAGTDVADVPDDGDDER
jgi:Domain of unknown function (DUF3362)